MGHQMQVLNFSDYTRHPDVTFLKNILITVANCALRDYFGRIAKQFRLMD